MWDSLACLFFPNSQNFSFSFILFSSNTTIKDKAVYDRMVNYMDLNTYGVPRETQLRTLKLLNVVLEGNSRKMFDFGYDAMRFLWEKLTKIISGSKRFSLQDLTPKHCTFSEELRAPTPAFAWIKCKNEEDEDCHAVLREAKIIGRAGHVFGAEKRYVRLNLVNSQDDFELLQNRLEMLVFHEKMANLMASINLNVGGSTGKNNFSAPLNASAIVSSNHEMASEEESTSSIHSALRILQSLLF